MTRRATFSEADLRRAIRVAEQEGRELAGCKIHSGTVELIFQPKGTAAPSTASTIDTPKSSADERKPGAWN